MKMVKSLTRAMVVMGLLALLPAARGSVADAPATDAMKNPCLKYAPSGWWLMGNFDLKSVMAAMLKGGGAGNEGQKAMLKQYMALAQMFTGLDLEKDVDYVTFFGAGDPDVKPTGLIVVKGTFDEQVVEDTLVKTMAKGMVKTEIGKVPMYANETMALCFPETGTMVIGDPALVKEAAAAAGKKTTFEPAVTHTLERTDGNSIVWLAVRPGKVLGVKALAAFCADHAELVKNLSKAECISLCGMEADGGYAISAQASMEAEAQAKGLHDYLAARKKAISETEGVNTLGLSALVMSKLETSGPYVRASLQLTMQAMEDLWNTKVVLKK